MLRKLIKFIGISAILLAMAIGLSPIALYLWGTSKLPENQLPPHSEAPPLAQEILWKAFGGSGKPALRRENPYSYLYQLFSNDTDFSNLQLSDAAGRMLLRREGGPERPNHLVRANTAIWVSRNWTASEALTAVLESAYFGHGFIGINEAAAGYYGLQPRELSDFDMAKIVAIEKGASMFDPWCNPERNLLRAQLLLGSTAEPKEPSKLLAKPVGACN